MRCPIRSKEYVKAGWLEKHIAQCRGSQTPSSLRVRRVDLSNPSPPRLVTTSFDSTRASSSPVFDVVGRRLPRLYRKIPFALRAEAQRAFLLPLRRLRENSRDVGAWMLFLMFPCWCLALPFCGGVAGHRCGRFSNIIVY